MPYFRTPKTNTKKTLSGIFKGKDILFIFLERLMQYHPTTVLVEWFVWSKVVGMPLLLCREVQHRVTWWKAEKPDRFTDMLWL